MCIETNKNAICCVKVRGRKNISSMELLKWLSHDPWFFIKPNSIIKLVVENQFITIYFPCFVEINDELKKGYCNRVVKFSNSQNIWNCLQNMIEWIVVIHGCKLSRLLNFVLSLIELNEQTLCCFILHLKKDILTLFIKKVIKFIDIF